jgi:Membrane bound beta barrel domain (DUF5777)/Putative Ig domain
MRSSIPASAILMSIALAMSAVTSHAADAAKPATTVNPAADRPHLASGAVGQPFRFAVNFKNKPDHFEATGLPRGLTLDRETGVISGTPTSTGVSTVILSAFNAKGRGDTRIVITIKEAPAVTEQEVVVATTVASTKSAADEPDVADPNEAIRDLLHPWTDSMRRTVQNALLPAPTTLPGGDWYYRIVHTALDTYYDNWETQLLGLDDSVKIGFLIAYGLADNWDVAIQRTNGYSLQTDFAASETTSFDYYDIMFKHKFLDQYDGALGMGGLADAAITAGGTVMQRNQGVSQVSLNLGFLVERNFFSDRLRLGSGVFYSSISAYEGASTVGPPTKLFSDEYDALVAQGNPPAQQDEESTTAIPFTAIFAVDEHWQLYGEAILPIAGYETGDPSLLTGVRFNTNTHQYSLYFSNTANVAFNSVITGGVSTTSLPFFGFYITSYF